MANNRLLLNPYGRRINSKSKAELSLRAILATGVGRSGLHAWGAFHNKLGACGETDNHPVPGGCDISPHAVGKTPSKGAKCLIP